LSDEKFAELAEREEFLLSITEKGFGARSSAYDYRITGRGGQGLNNMTLAKRDDHVVAVFAVTHKDQIMLVTDGGTVIRCPVFDIRMARRPSQGVVVFKVGEGEHVVSVARLADMGDENGGGNESGEGNGSEGDGGGNGAPSEETPPPAEQG
jgi:DNA gyrase subunit A